MTGFRPSFYFSSDPTVLPKNQMKRSPNHSSQLVPWSQVNAATASQRRPPGLTRIQTTSLQHGWVPSIDSQQV
jgi:hypothetical protein